MKKKKMGEKGKRERKRRGKGRCAPAATAAAVGHAWCRHASAGHGDGHAARREGRKKERGKKRGEIRGGRTRRVALGGKWMGRELNSGVGLFRRNPGN